MEESRPRVALVTGSSRGLGAAIAGRLARDGLAVAVNGRRDDGQVVEVAGSIRDAGGLAAAFPADVTDERQVSELVAAVGDVLGPVQVLVVNATGPQPEAPLSDVDWQDHLAQLSFFVRSPVLLGRAVLPAMQADRFGRIIQIDSDPDELSRATALCPDISFDVLDQIKDQSKWLMIRFGQAAKMAILEYIKPVIHSYPHVSGTVFQQRRDLASRKAASGANR